MRSETDYSLKRHNTFGIEARCRRFLEYTDADEAKAVAAFLRQSPSERYLIIGGGSNLLLTGDFPGTVVHSACRGIDICGDGAGCSTAGDRADGVKVRCGSGETWDDVVDWLIAHDLYGAENLSLIPGDVGASAVQNIGAYGVEAKDLIDCVEAVEIATGALTTFSNEECRYGYRHSRFKDDWRGRYLITSVTYRLSTTFSPRLDYGNIRSELQHRHISEPTARELRDVIIDIRRHKLPDPAVTGNAGSFFMNPIVSRRQFEQLLSDYPAMPHYPVDAEHEKIPAGWMIEQCGWKGRRVGRAGVYERQALVLVNLGCACGTDIVRLCDAIRHDVRRQFGIDIHPEVNIV